MKQNLIPSAVVALVVSLLAFAGFSVMQPTAEVPSLPGAEATALGDINGVAIESPYVFKAGSGDGGDFLTITENGTINAGSNQGSWRNDTNRTVFIDTVSLFPTGTASTTFIYYVGTSTAATYTSDYTAPYATLIDGYRIPTSTPQLVINNHEHAGTLGRNIISVDPGEYVNIAFFQGYLETGCTGATCETATSTNRGFNLDWYLRGHFKP